MTGRWKPGWSAVAVVAAVYILIFSAVRYNLAVEAAAAADLPVTVVVDAGHGGEDGGAVSGSGVTESEINLQISRRLEQLLALCGMKPEMIRREDTAVYSEGAKTFSEKKVSDLKNRVKTVNGIEHAVLLSIHQNHFSESQYSGAQVFYAKTPGSKDLAQAIQETLRQGLDPENNRQIKTADTVYLMKQIQCTGVLVECGFLSNPQEDYNLQQASYQKKLACAICAGLGQYLEGEQNLEV